jgi:hypothetical protein
LTADHRPGLAFDDDFDTLEFLVRDDWQSHIAALCQSSARAATDKAAIATIPCMI